MPPPSRLRIRDSTGHYDLSLPPSYHPQVPKVREMEAGKDTTDIRISISVGISKIGGVQPSVHSSTKEVIQELRACMTKK